MKIGFDNDRYLKMQSEHIKAGDPARNRELADYNNQRLGVTAAQQMAMEAGSMHGWDCPAADPKTYEQGPFQMGGMQLG